VTLVDEPLDPHQHFLQVFVCSQRGIPQFPYGFRLTGEICLKRIDAVDHAALQSVDKGSHRTALRFFEILLQLVLDFVKANVDGGLNDSRNFDDPALQGLDEGRHGTVLRLFEIPLQLLLDFAETNIERRLNDRWDLRVQLIYAPIDYVHIAAQLFYIPKLRRESGFKGRKRFFGDRRGRCRRSADGLDFDDPIFYALQTGQERVQVDR
jgi:hypothetical protein